MMIGAVTWRSTACWRGRIFRREAMRPRRGGSLSRRCNWLRRGWRFLPGVGVDVAAEAIADLELARGKRPSAQPIMAISDPPMLYIENAAHVLLQRRAAAELLRKARDERALTTDEQRELGELERALKTNRSQE